MTSAATSVRTPNCSPIQASAAPSRAVRCTVPASERRRLVEFVEGVMGDHRPALQPIPDGEVGTRMDV